MVAVRNEGRFVSLVVRMRFMLMIVVLIIMPVVMGMIVMCMVIVHSYRR